MTIRQKPVTLSLGEVLWDMLPDGKALGGSPTNAAWHAAQLGADAHVASAVGADPLGGEILDILRGKGMNVDGIASIPGKPTSTVDAILGPDGNATYVIHADVAWDYMPVAKPILDIVGEIRGMNFGSLSQRGAMTRESTLAILDAAPRDSVRVFDINFRPPFVFRDILADGLARSSVVKMNNDELPVLANLFGWSANQEKAIEDLLQAYPNLGHAVVTRGADGIWWHNRARLMKKRPRAQPKVVDTIGAGDSVTASAMMGLLKGWDEERILETALDIASYVCTQRGGMPELPPDLKAPYLA